MTHTILSFLNTIPDQDIRNRALANMDKSVADGPCDSLRTAIRGAFNWSATPEGLPFWSSFCYNISGDLSKSSELVRKLILEQINHA